MKSSRLFCSSSACYIFVALVSAVAAVQTKSEVQNLQPVTTDGPNDSIAQATADTIISSAEFASRQGFQPSVDFARFAAEERASSSNTKNNTIKFTVGEEYKPKQIRSSRIPHPAVLKLYDGKYNASSTEQVAKEEALPKYPKVYYGDLLHSNPSASDHTDVHNDIQINNIESELSKHHHQHHVPQHHEPHHDNHNYGEEAKKEDEGGDSKYYYPKNLLTKYPSEHKHHHIDEEKHYSIEHPPTEVHHVHNSYGHLHGHSYGYPESHQHYSNSLPYEHSHHSSLKYTDQKGHVLEGAFGKALHLLLPSALFLGGVSALFPNRVHVPTTENKYRQRRSISYQTGSSDPEDFGDIPAKYLKREHRSNDEEGIELDLDEQPFHLPNMRPALTHPSRGHTSGRNYNNPRLTPHQRFEFSPPRSHQSAGRQRHRSRPSQQSNNNDNLNNSNDNRNNNNNDGRNINNDGRNINNDNRNNNNADLNREIPEQYDAFLFNNPGSFNFDIPPPTFSPDSEPSPLPPTYPSDPSQTTEEMISEEEMPEQPAVTQPSKRPSKMKKNKNQTPSSGSPRFIPIPIEEPVLDNINPETTTEMEMEFPEATTTRKPMSKKQESSRKGNSMNRESRRNNQKISDPMQSLQGIAALNKLTDNENMILTKPKNVDLSPDGPVIGLLSSYAQHDKDSPECQKKALCELAMKGATPVSTKFESFLWNLANLVPDQFSQLYDLEEIFSSIRKKECEKFACKNPNMDLQE